MTSAMYLLYLQLFCHLYANHISEANRRRSVSNKVIVEITAPTSPLNALDLCLACPLAPLVGSTSLSLYYAVIILVFLLPYNQV
jgi:dihydrodipicolinate reductase